MPESERRLAAIMFTDIVGYTKLMQENESATVGILKDNRELIRPLFTSHGGKEIKTIGDAFLVEFNSALDATLCAIAVQSALNDRKLSRGEKLDVRVGIHVGDVIESKGDILGDAVNVASRIVPLAEPGGVCISGQVYDQVKNKIPYQLFKTERRELKNVRDPVDVYRVALPWETHRESEPESPVLDRKRVAVLPFANMSPDPDDEYFADGMTEELISALSRVSGLGIISRTSVMGYRNKDKKASEIAKELKVGTLLEGSVRKAANKVRITVQLIDATADQHFWAEAYDRSLEDVFAIQSEVAQRVASSLQAKLAERDREAIGKGGTSNMEAHALYLKGLFQEMKGWDSRALKKAINYYEQAIAQDSNYALAYCGLATTHAALGYLDISNAQETFRLIEKYARKALELDDTLSDGHVALGNCLYYDFDFTGAEREYRIALELNPNSINAHNRLANLHNIFLRYDDCFSEVKKMLELDPLSVFTWGNAGTYYLYGFEYDQAIKHLENAMELDPGNTFFLDNLGLAHIQKGMLKEGLAEVKKAAETAGADALFRELAYAYVKAGMPEEARKILTSLLQRSDVNPRGPIDIAGVYAALGEKAQALDWLDRAFEEKSGYVASVGTDFVFESIWTEPRFKELQKKMGLGT